MLYLAAMEGIDPQLYEAAELDGASASRQFFGITLPLIWEVVIISAVFLVISGLNAFEMIWLLTSQDPASASHTLGTLMVTSMFKELPDRARGGDRRHHVCARDLSPARG